MSTAPFQGIPGLEEQVPLALHTYIKIGGPADYFLKASTSQVVQQVVTQARRQGVPWRVIGGGANLLVADAGFRGLVIRSLQQQCTITGTTVRVGAGYPLSKLASDAAGESLSGLEFALGIPGTVGGAVYGNAGAFDGEMKDVLTRAWVLDATGKVVERSNTALGFAYRHSALKENGEVLLEVELQLREGERDAIQTLQHQRLLYRKEHQPLNLPSLGSVFKNVPLSAFSEKVIGQYALREHLNPLGVVPAGFLVDRMELKGYRIGDAQISEKHGNFIVNVGRATAEHVMMLVSAVKQKARLAYGGVQLTEEIQYLGFDQ